MVLAVNSARFLLRFIVVTLLLGASTLLAQHKLKDEDCLACHGDSALTSDHNGKTVSLFVDQKQLKHSIHGSLFSCVDCHKDVTSLAHDKTPAKITCGQCHAKAQAAYDQSTHATGSKPGSGPA